MPIVLMKAFEISRMRFIFFAGKRTNRSRNRTFGVFSFDESRTAGVHLLLLRACRSGGGRIHLSLEDTRRFADVHCNRNSCCYP
jgi:hypothetical protein